MPNGDVETPKEVLRELVMSNRELTAELKLMRSEIARFNLFIASISQKAGVAGIAQSLIETFLNISGKKKR